MKGIGIQVNDHNDTGDILDLKIEPVRDSSNKIVSGLVVGSTLEQNISFIMILHQGELKSNPDLGVGIEDIALSEDYLGFRHKIREHLKKDGLVVSQLDLFEGKPFKIVAEYGK
ncbi:hypothetical protein QWY99_01290 [Flavobacterium branchiarum]|uniref:Uncharacterized protein n=1 Tax=Flavobacterium branchiarum TaxID=1114870 RepID=A0ABV5FQW7_9FLAO|nr:hypothetical protein [Flavobacterium branchiarum]MDN3671700.1 hypothetical protein [Flavobacterium branchiarum]